MRSSNHLVLGGPGHIVDGPGPPRSLRRRAEIVDVRAEPPVVIRQAGERVLFGAAAAGPLGGDRIDLHVEVESGVVADVGTVGATMVLPAREPAWSTTSTTVTVGAGSHLEWHPEPMISVVGSTHQASLHVRLEASATARITEEFSLGRSGEASGTLVSSLRVEWGRRPVLVHCETYGPGQPGAGSVAAGPQRGHVITSLVVAGPGDEPGGGHGPDQIVEGASWAGVFPLAVPGAVLWCAVAPDRPAAIGLVDQLAARAAPTMV